MMPTAGKKYGLIIRKKTTPLAKPAAAITSKNNKLSIKNVFDDSDSSDSEKQIKKKENRHRDIIQRNMKKQTLMDMQKALEEDATVYEYDAVYDQMKEEKEKKSSTAKGSKDRKPKYIQSLMKASQRRERERLRVEERKIEKERSQEGGEFADKQQFVTSAYRKRLQERAEEERLEREEAEREAKYDVRKQSDLSGFYRHLLRQQTGEANEKEEHKKPIAEHSKSRKREEVSSDEERSRGEKRREEVYSDEEKNRGEERREEESCKEGNDVDADSDFDVDSSSSDEGEQEENERVQEPPEKPKQAKKRPAKDDESTPSSTSSKFAKRNADASKLEALRKRFEARQKNRGDVTSRD